MAAPTSAGINGTRIDIAYENGNKAEIKVSAVSAIDKEQNTVTIYHSGDKHLVRFANDSDANTFFNAIEAAIS